MAGQTKDRAKTTPAVMFIKILLHLFNFLYFVIGSCVLGIGILIQVKLKPYMELTQLYYDNAAYVMIGVGVLIILISIGGCFCTAKDKIALLYMYAIFISLIAILEVAAGIAGGAFANKIDSKLTTELEKSITKKNEPLWNDIQKQLKCCGVNGTQDWKGIGVPASCYKGGKTPAPTHNPPSATTTAAPATTVVEATTTTPPPPPTTTEEEELTTESTNPPSSTPGKSPSVRRKRAASDTEAYPGCRQKIIDEAKHYMGVIIGICIGFVAIQVIGAVLACCLARKTSKNNYEQIY